MSISLQISLTLFIDIYKVLMQTLILRILWNWLICLPSAVTRKIYGLQRTSIIRHCFGMEVG
jgi:hypothetical protein